MVTIIGLCGSLRNGSFNRMLLHAAVESSPPGTTIEPESIGEIPLYDADLEEQGMPLVVQRLKDRIAHADGLLIVTPEYNNSIPGVLKNAIDWLSRPADDIPRVFRGRPVAILGATIGSGGTALSQAAWLPVLRFLGMRPWFERAVLISDAARQFDGDGRLADQATRQRIRTFVEGFGAFAAQHGPHTVLATPNPQVDMRGHGVMASGHRERTVMTYDAGLRHDPRTNQTKTAGD